MRLLPFVFALSILPTIAQSGVIETEYEASLKNFYGYTKYSSPYEKFNKENNFNSSLNFYGRATYEHNSKYSTSLIGYFMVDSAKEVENYNQGIWGEEVFALTETPWGDVSVGQDSNVAYKLAVGAPEIGVFHTNNTELVNFINNPNWYKKGHKTAYKTLNSTYINTDGASAKINYVSPEWKGLKFGATYVPKTYSQSGLVVKNASYKDKEAYVLGTYGSWNIRDYEIETSLGFADFRDNDKEYSLGTSVYHKGWTLGGSYRKTDSEKTKINKVTLFDGYRQGRAYNIGISYEFGPLKTGLTYFDSKADNSKNHDEIISISNSYQYKKYTTFSFTVAHLLSKGADNQIQNNNKGYAFILGLELKI